MSLIDIIKKRSREKNRYTIAKLLVNLQHSSPVATMNDPAAELQSVKKMFTHELEFDSIQTHSSVELVSWTGRLKDIEIQISVHRYYNHHNRGTIQATLHGFFNSDSEHYSVLYAGNPYDIVNQLEKRWIKEEKINLAKDLGIA